MSSSRPISREELVATISGRIAAGSAVLSDSGQAFGQTPGGDNLLAVPVAHGSLAGRPSDDAPTEEELRFLDEMMALCAETAPEECAVDDPALEDCAFDEDPFGHSSAASFKERPAGDLQYFPGMLKRGKRFLNPRFHFAAPVPSFQETPSASGPASSSSASHVPFFRGAPQHTTVPVLIEDADVSGLDAHHLKSFLDTSARPGVIARWSAQGTAIRDDGRDADTSGADSESLPDLAPTDSENEYGEQ